MIGIRWTIGFLAVRRAPPFLLACPWEVGHGRTAHRGLRVVKAGGCSFSILGIASGKSLEHPIPISRVDADYPRMSDKAFDDFGQIVLVDSVGAREYRPYTGLNLSLIHI